MAKKINQIWRLSRPSGQISPRAAQLIGAADDRGVLNVGGRLGAGHGPQAVRQLLGQYMLGIDGALDKIDLFAGADPDPGETIEAGHRAIRGAVSAAIGAGVVPIVLGGGHDYGYPHFAGVADAVQESVALINVDAHLDVRPPGPEGITSGSPFFLALEEGILKPELFVEFGIQEHCNDAAFYAYAKRKGVRILSLDECRADEGPSANLAKLVSAFVRAKKKVVVSFDIDAIQMAFAPGVSAPQSDGFTPADFLGMARFCGECPEVLSIGIFETAPSLDEGNRTVRLAATALHRFLCGLSRRGEKRSTRRILKKTLKKTQTRVGRLLRRR